MMRDYAVSHPWYQGKNSSFYSDILSPAYIVFTCNKDSDVHPLTQIPFPQDLCSYPPTYIASHHPTKGSLPPISLKREKQPVLVTSPTTTGRY